MGIEDKYLNERKITDGKMFIKELKRDLATIEESFIHKSAMTSVVYVIESYNDLLVSLNSLSEEEVIEAKKILNKIFGKLDDMIKAAEVLIKQKGRINKIVDDIENY